MKSRIRKKMAKQQTKAQLKRENDLLRELNIYATQQGSLAAEKAARLESHSKLLAEQLKGTMQPGGYAYFSEASKKSDAEAANARYVAERLQAQLANQQQLRELEQPRSHTVAVIENQLRICKESLDTVIGERDFAQKKCDESYRIEKLYEAKLAAATKDAEGLVKKVCDLIRAELQRVSKGEPHTWGFVAMFHDMITKAESAALASSTTEARESGLRFEWNCLCAKLASNNWTVGESATYFGFFAHGWYGRGNEAAYQQSKPAPSPAGQSEGMTK